MCYVAFAGLKASKSHFWQRPLLDLDIDAFKSDIAKLHDSDPNALVDLYNSVLRDTLDKRAPVVSRSITLHPHTPWFTEELRDAKRKRRRCEWAYRKSRLAIHEQIYREHCRSYAMLLENTKAQYYSSKIEEADQKDLFRLIDGMFHVKPVLPLPSHESVEQLTEKFSCFFIDKIESLRHGIIGATIPPMSVSIDTSCTCSMSDFAEVSLKSVWKTIQNSPSNSCASDPIPTRTLKAGLSELPAPVIIIVNSSLRSSVFQARPLLRK